MTRIREALAASSPDGGEAHSEAAESHFVLRRIDREPLNEDGWTWQEVDGPDDFASYDGPEYEVVRMVVVPKDSGVAAPPDSDRGTKG